MIRNTPRTAAKFRRCSSCDGPIRLGALYLESVASPDHGELGNPGWWRMDECVDCAQRYGRGPLLAT